MPACVLTISVLVVLLCGHVAAHEPVVSECWHTWTCLPKTSLSLIHFISFLFLDGVLEVVKIFIGHFRSKVGFILPTPYCMQGPQGHWCSNHVMYGTPKC